MDHFIQLTTFKTPTPQHLTQERLTAETPRRLRSRANPSSPRWSDQDRPRKATIQESSFEVRPQTRGFGGLFLRKGYGGRDFKQKANHRRSMVPLKGRGDERV